MAVVGLLACSKNVGAQSYELLHAFSAEAGSPASPLLQATDGKLYGLTMRGGFAGLGSVFVLTPNGFGGFAFSNLHEFGGTDGSKPQYASLMQATDGNLYGATTRGGQNGYGTVFRISLTGSLTTLHSFTLIEGTYAHGVVQGVDGNFYGTTHEAGKGYGTVYRMTPSGILTILHSFLGTDGAGPYSDLIQATDGNFYGTTAGGGASGYGTVFRIGSSGPLTTLHSFTNSEGRFPIAGLVQAADGDFYGATHTGGEGGVGTVFRMTSSGTLTTLHSFATTDGANPRGTLIRATDGNFYGTTNSGGSSGYGTAFQITASGTLTTLHSFDSTDGANLDAGLIQAGDGNFYGTTSGTVFQITPDGTLTVLHAFVGVGGYRSQTGVIQSSDGNFYGTTQNGGSGGRGTVFQLTPSGSLLDTVYSFTAVSGGYPNGLIQAADGDFYGTTHLGGTSSRGSVFRVTPSGTLTTIQSFGEADGSSCCSALIQTTDGNFYGTTERGLVSDGTVFQVSPSGTLTTLHNFLLPGGHTPQGLVEATDGNLYGTTKYGGADDLGFGTVFRVTPAGALTVLHSFSETDGANPTAPLIQGTDGNFYGTTFDQSGGGYGTIFRLTPAGALTSLHTFSKTDGSHPSAGLIQATDGNFYGTTASGGGADFGTIFRVTPSGTLTTLHTFTGTDGTGSPTSLIEATDGSFYGTSGVGGPGNGGVIFRLSLCSAPIATASGTSTICAGASAPLIGSGGTCAWFPQVGLSDARSCSPVASPSSTTTYTLIVTDPNGCESTTYPTVKVTVNPSPSAVITGPASVCANRKGNRASVPFAGTEASYQWTITSGTIIGGSGTNSVTFTPDAAGAVHLAVSVTSNCGSDYAEFDAPIVTCHLEPEALFVNPPGPYQFAANGILEPNEHSMILVKPSWKNVGGNPLALSGVASNFVGPAGSYGIIDGSADYGSVSAGATSDCGVALGSCYSVQLDTREIRPVTHWDATLTETLSNGEPPFVWTLHIGKSFSDVATTHTFYPFVEKILHHGVTTGCTPTTYCPDESVFRLQMAAFIARAQAGGDARVPSSGPGYSCAIGGTSLFSDVAPDNPFCRHVHYIHSTGVTTGCEPGKYCPNSNVSRGQMALFIARAIAGGDAAVPQSYGPDPVTGRSYSCSPANPNLHFTDVAASDIFCRHTHYLWAKDVISGFPDNSYGPSLDVSRGAMAKFLANGFQLNLYGP